MLNSWNTGSNFKAWLFDLILTLLIRLIIGTPMGFFFLGGGGGSIGGEAKR